MSDLAKWALLVAGAILAVTMVLAVAGDPFNYLDQMGEIIAGFALVAEPYLRFGRGLINNFFLSPSLVTGVLWWVLVKWFVKLSVRILAWVYHYIFK